jgi:hypothetical protein
MTKRHAARSRSGAERLQPNLLRQKKMGYMYSPQQKHLCLKKNLTLDGINLEGQFYLQTKPKESSVNQHLNRITNLGSSMELFQTHH